MSAPMKQPLNPKEMRVFDWIVAYKITHNGNSPTIREIMEGVSFLSSTSNVRYYLDKLHDKGWIVAEEDGSSRNIVVVGGRWSYDKSDGANCLTPNVV